MLALLTEALITSVTSDNILRSLVDGKQAEELESFYYVSKDVIGKVCSFRPYLSLFVVKVQIEIHL